jgi:glycosyltransferase involved in cell wall biosynthesis
LKHVLIIAFHYPPESSSSGVLRTLKYSRYLRTYGWRVSVLTLREDAYAIRDERLVAQIPSDTRLIRTGHVELRRKLSVAGRYPSILATPDAWIGWFPFAVRAGLKSTRQDPVDVVYSTSPYATAHLIAWRLSRSLGVPSVVDFRDPWFEEPPESGTPALKHWFARRLERCVIERAAHVIASTPALRDVFRSRYRRVGDARFSCIPNGYDEADFTEIDAAGPAANDRLEILHAGSINPEFRDPRPLFEAVGRLIAAGQFAPQEICLRFVGPGDYADSPEMTSCIERAGLKGSVVFGTRVDYRQSLQSMRRASVLLLLQDSEDTASLVPAKLYEYLRMRRPVLALVRPGAAGDVMSLVGGGWSVNPRDAAQLDRALQFMVTLWRTGELASRVADMEALQQFDRKLLAGRLAAILDSVVGERGLPVASPR